MTFVHLDTSCEQEMGKPSRASVVPAFKRPFDLVLTTLLVLSVLPILAVIAVLVRFSGPGPIIFRQIRIGLDGEPFTMFKFRSMVVDAEAQLGTLSTRSDRDGVCFKMAKDPRVTPIGRVLRRLSLDELPQLFNVLKGDMSLVGPRPGLPSEVSAYRQLDLQRLQGLPGITGAWQVAGRADLSFDQMIELDLHYLRTASLRTDLTILLATFGAVLGGRGAS